MIASTGLRRSSPGLQAPADFVNMSFGVHGLVENYGGLSFGPLYAPAIAALAQTGRQTGRTVLVIAAGNDHGGKCQAPEQNCVGGRIDASSPTLIAGLPVLEESLRRHVVAVVATDRRGRIASFSNRCGIAAKWCIAAPGVDIPIAYSRDGDRGYATASGTSLAAPHVTGGLAVLKHWFRGQLANEDLLARLYSTARMTPDSVPSGGSCPAHLDLDGDPGECELSSELGRGLMDLGAAIAPVGATSIVLRGSAGGRRPVDNVEPDRAGRPRRRRLAPRPGGTSDRRVRRPRRAVLDRCGPFSCETGRGPPGRRGSRAGWTAPPARRARAEKAAIAARRRPVRPGTNCASVSVRRPERT